MKLRADQLIKGDLVDISGPVLGEIASSRWESPDRVRLELRYGVAISLPPAQMVTIGGLRDPEMGHVNYPHEPGRLYDCPACDARCFCTSDPGQTECVFEGEHRWSEMRRYGIFVLGDGQIIG